MHEQISPLQQSNGYRWDFFLGKHLGVFSPARERAVNQFHRDWDTVFRNFLSLVPSDPFSCHSGIPR